jgi:hypothetical protein
VQSGIVVQRLVQSLHAAIIRQSRLFEHPGQKTVKLPRWLVVILLSVSVLIPLGAGAWWWVTWPERTFHRFMNALAVSDFEQAHRLTATSIFLSGPDWSEFVEKTDSQPDQLSLRFQPVWNDWNIRPMSRSFSDVAFGRQRFDVGKRWAFSVYRTKVVGASRWEGNPMDVVTVLWAY